LAGQEEIVRTRESYPLPFALKRISVSSARVRAAALVAFALVGAGCSSDAADDAPPTIEPARPAASPPAAVTPAGAVQPLPGRPAAAVFDAGAGALVVLIPGEPSALRVLGPTPATIDIPGDSTALTSDNRGTAYVAGRGGYSRVDLASGAVVRVDLPGAADTEFTAVTLRADDGPVLGSATGAVYLLNPGGSDVEHREEIFARVDALAAVGDTTVVLDRGQTSVTSVNSDGDRQQALRAGDGATSIATDPEGRVLVTDTRGGELLVFGVDPLIMRQRYPVPAAPYGIAGSTDLTWVSQTATNTVIGYDLATGIPVEKVRYPTVQQPDFVAFDDAADTLYVVSGSGAGVQVIESASRP
jgi:DNA-binding beta-propeller fold protein YncE